MSTPIRIAALTLATLLAACGGGGTEGAAAPKTTQQVMPTLLDDEDQVQPSAPAAEPADPGARTRAGRYATPAQADALERALGTNVISTRVERGADDSAAVDLAVLGVYGMQAALNLDNQAPVLVRGSDPRLAAATANRLADNGFTRVFLVTQ